MRRNFIANLAGTGWSILLQLVFTPVWIHQLGAEAYGLIGFHLLVVGLCTVFDAGLSPAINREAARLLADGDPGGKLGGVARGAVGALAAIGLVVAVVTAWASPAIASHWLDAPTLPSDEVQRCVAMSGWIAGLLIAANAPVAVLQGMESQLALNLVRMTCATAANVAAAVLIAVGGSDIEGWFACQLIAAAVQYLLLFVVFVRSLPRGAWASARFDLTALRPMARFAAEMGFVAAAGVVLTQVDRLILSRALDLVSFGWYTLATVVASGVRLLAMPVFNAVYPRFTSCLQRGDVAGLLRLHRRSTQALVLLIIPPSAVMLIAPYDLLLLWTHRLDAADGAASVLRLLAIGAMVNAFLHVPYAVQLGAGWTKLILSISLASIVVMIPGVWLAARSWGVIGAACAWPILNLLTAMVIVPVVHRRFQLGPGWKWVAGLIGSIALGSISAMAGLAVVRYGWSGEHALLGLVLAGGTAFAALSAWYFLGSRREADVARPQEAPGSAPPNG